MAKGKKQRKTNDSDEEIPNEIHSEEEVAEPVQNAGKKGKKDRKKKKEAELEEAQMELEALANDDLADLPEEDVKPKKNKKEKKKKKVESESEGEEESAPVVKKSGFSAFLMEDSEDDHAVDSDEAPVIIKAPEPEPKKKSKKKSAKTEEVKDDFGDGDDEKENNKKKKKKKKKGGAQADEEEDELEKALAELNIEKKEDESAKSAAQKKKEKKERQKQKQLEELKEPSEDKSEAKEKSAEPEAVEAETEGKGKKKGKKKEAEEDAKGKKGKKPGKGTLAAMQEALKKVQEEQEKAKREEEERIKREEEAEKERLEKKRLEEEKKALKKQREKERKEQLRKEGKLLTPKQRAEKARAEQMLAAMRAQGLDVPEAGVKLGPRPGTRIRNKNKAKSQTPEVEEKPTEPEVVEKVEPEPKPEPEVKEPEPKPDEEDDVLDSWDAESEGEDEKKDDESEDKSEQTKAESEAEASDEEEESDESEGESDSESDESDDSEEESEEEHIEDRRDRAIARIQKRKAENEANRSTDVLRAPVVVVMGHVDTGKTKILDKLRRTNVQDGEAGGITQQIGATNVPIEVIHEQCKMVTDYKPESNKLPGLLIIDTPGHESFSNLRDRGSSLCDFAILVVDIMHGLEPQTIESINLLKKKKVPFVIALNKIDRLYEWKSNRHKDVREVIESQNRNTKLEFEKRAREVVVSMAEQGLNCALYYENPNPKEYISMVPTSAHSGEGMGNIMALIVHLSQTVLAKRLAFSEELQATVLEVKAIPGLGTTIDIVLLNGKLREGQTMIVAGTEGPIVTQIKALLTPSKMQDLRVKNQWLEHKEIRAAQGVKIAAKELEKTVAGLNLLVANHADEVEICKEEMEKRLATALNSIKVKALGVFVQASTLGSLEALLEFLRSSKIPYAGVKIGPVVKKDVMKASVMLEHEPKYTVILAFDVKIERDAQELADTSGVKIFQADIIYHLFDHFTKYQEDLKRQKREEFKHIAVFPCKFKMMPNFVFNSRDPIVAGVQVEAGIIRQGTPICVPSKGFLEIGIITSIQSNHKEVETARKGEEVCVKIEPIPGESPKMFGRHFDETDMLVSKISRASIDACKDYFREDLQKSDWQLMVELKKIFEIL